MRALGSCIGSRVFCIPGIRVSLGMELLPVAFLRGEERYAHFQRLSQGTYGTVSTALDKVYGALVCVKTQKFPSTSARRELAFYSLLRCWPHANVLNMLDHFFTTNVVADSTQTLNIVLPFCATSLHAMFMIEVGRLGLRGNARVVSYVADLLRGLMLLHGLHVIHGDLSMGNLFITVDHSLSICDLGGSLTAHDTTRVPGD